MKDIITIFFVFFKTGAFTLGGGSAVIPVVLKEATQRKWLTREDFLDAIGLINCLPGPISTNISTFTGYQVKKLPGAAAALLGVITPSIIIVILLCMLFQHIMDYPVVQAVFNGIRPAVVAIVIDAVYKLAKPAKLSKYFNWVWVIIGLAGIAVFDIHPIILVAVAALYGLFVRSHLVKAMDARAAAKKGDDSDAA